MKSILARLEALEAKTPSTFILEVTLDDGSIKEVNFSEFMAMRKEPYHKDGIYYSGLPKFRIIGGHDLSELDELIGVYTNMCVDIIDRKK